MILDLLSEYNNITINQLIDKVKKSRPTITRALTKLKEQGKIKRIGTNKKGWWEVIK